MSVVTPFPHPRDRQSIATFDRIELQRILDLYGRMVAAGNWRDYGLSFHPDVAIFAAFRRATERPEVRIVSEGLGDGVAARCWRQPRSRKGTAFSRFCL